MSQRSNRRTLTLALGLGVVIATVLGTAPAARAQYAPGYYPPPPPPPPRGVYRSGVVWGFGLGAGGMSMPDCGQVCGAVGMAEFHLGGMIAPRMAVMADFWQTFRYFTDPIIGSGESYNGIYTAALQFWVNDILWLKGGVGIGHLVIGGYADVYGYTFPVDNETGFAFMLAGGVELVQSYNYALDLQLRYGNAVYSPPENGGGGDTNQFGVLVGFNWY